MKFVVHDLAEATERFAVASHDLIAAIAMTGMVVNASEVGPGRRLERSHVIAGVILDITRAAVILQGLQEGADVLEVAEYMARLEGRHEGRPT